MIQKFLVMLGSELITKLFKAIADAIKNSLRAKQIEKESKEKTDEIIHEQDPKIRAQRMRDMLNP